MTYLLEAKNLTVIYGGQPGTPPALSAVSLGVATGACLGIVGESGSGKTTLGHALIGVLDADVRATGDLMWKDQKIRIGGKQHQSLRGVEIGFVSQEASAALNPSITVQGHFFDALHDVLGADRQTATALALHWLDQVQMDDPRRYMRRYPHQLSGGQRQRVLIALALCTKPVLIVLDECTSALDLTVQAQILRLLADLRGRLGLSMLVISHDLDLVASLADDVAVLYAGQVLEQGPVDVFKTGRPYHPYTKGLVRSTPRLDTRLDRLPSIQGRMPDQVWREDDCVFRPRCPFARSECEAVQDFRPVPKGSVRCVRAPVLTTTEWPAANQPRAARSIASAFVLETRGLTKEFRDARGHRMRALGGVDLSIRRGETLGLVGESGAGKTTLARCLVGVLSPDEGHVSLDGRVVSDPKGLHSFPHHMIQILFQDPRSALNPRLRVIEQIARPILLYRQGSRRDSLRRASEMLDQVGLPMTLGRRYPHELSGGEAQRASIARALISRPSLVVLDEPVSALDVSTQAAVLNLLADLRDEMNIAYLLIGHDLAVVQHMADRVAVMQEGAIVELGDPDEIFRRPVHPHTRELVQALT